MFETPFSTSQPPLSSVIFAALEGWLQGNLFKTARKRWSNRTAFCHICDCLIVYTQPAKADLGHYNFALGGILAMRSRNLGDLFGPWSGRWSQIDVAEYANDMHVAVVTLDMGRHFEESHRKPLWERVPACHSADCDALTIGAISNVAATTLFTPNENLTNCRARGRGLRGENRHPVR